MAVTIGEVLDAYKAERESIVISFGNLSRATARLKSTPVEPLSFGFDADGPKSIGVLPADDPEVIYAAVAAFRAARTANGAAPATINRDLTVLRAALMRLWRHGKLQRPYVEVPVAWGAMRGALTPPQSLRLLEYCVGRTYTFAVIGLTTGARVTAICELTWDRIDFDARTVDFRAPHPKAHRRKSRAIVPMSNLLHAALVEERARSTSDRVIPFGPDTARRRLQRAAILAGLMEGDASANLDSLFADAPSRLLRISPHWLRHTAATNMLRVARMPLADVSAFLGHRDSKITERIYAHLLVEHLRPVADATDRILTPSHLLRHQREDD